MRSRNCGVRPLWAENARDLFRSRVSAVFVLCQGLFELHFGPGLMSRSSFWNELCRHNRFLENANFRKFHEIFKLVRVQTTKNHKFSSLARISLPRGAAVHIFHVARRALARRVIRRQWVILPRRAATELISWATLDRRCAKFV